MIAALVMAAGLASAPFETAAEELSARIASVAAAQSGRFLYSPDAAAADAAAESAAEAARAAGGGSRQAPKGRTARHTWQVTFAAGAATRYELGNVQYWRLGEQLVALTRREEWERLDPPTRARWRSEGDAEQRALVRMAAELERIVAPATLLKELVTAEAAVAKVEPQVAGPGASGPLEYVVTLAPAAVAPLLNAASKRKADRTADGGASEAGAAGAAPATPGDSNGAPRGSLRVRVVEGAIVRIDLEASAAGPDGALELRRRWELVHPAPPFEAPLDAVVALFARK